MNGKIIATVLLALIITTVNTQTIMAQEKITRTAGGKEAFQREMIFPIGEPNTAYAAYFTGNSYLAPVSTEQVVFSNVTFEPGCRNNWHIHHADKGGGQMLVCVAGRGWYQEEGKPAVEMLPGDVVHIPANVKHWHGAAADSWFAHLAFEIPGDNTSNEWLEPVSDEEYSKVNGHGTRTNNGNNMEENITLTQEWDKVFPLSDQVNHSKTTFRNRYGITLAADVYVPENASGKLPAVAVCGPFGAVKEQSSGLYAQELAKRGFVAIAFDPSFTGESGGEPRYVASPDINTEDFCAAVDYLSLREDVDPDQIGIVGICGWGGMAVNAAAIDTRIKATVASTMYDMSRVTANGYFDAADNADARDGLRRSLNAQRTEDYRNGTYALAGGLPEVAPEDAPQSVKDYVAYYKTERGYHSRSLNSNGGWNKTSALSFLNMPILSYAGEIRSAVLLVHGENAHSRYFSEDTFKKLKGDNKELLIVPGAVHTDLYDNMDKIPFDRIESFLRSNMQR